MLLHFPQLCVLATMAFFSTAVFAQPLFVEVGAERGVESYQMALPWAGGVAAADYDGDGWIDFFVPNAEGKADQLYRNLGDGSFAEIAAEVGLAQLRRGRNALWLDVDGDRDLDLVVGSDCRYIDCLAGMSLLRLFRNDQGVFTEVTEAAGLVDDAAGHGTFDSRGGLVAGDIDGDGYLDLFAGMWVGQARLFRNQGDGTFVDISLASGVGWPSLGHWQPLMHDFDGDGRQDIFAAIDFKPNLLWRNQGDGTFVDAAAAAGVGYGWNEMGSTLGDYDGDGDLDLYVTNITFEGKHNTLYRNRSVGGQLDFVEVAQAAGVADGGWGWGTTFLDVDNDGDLDLAETNGWRDLEDSSRLFIHQGDDPPTFVEMASASGFADTLWGFALVAFDADRDGDLDLLQTCEEGQVRLLDNQLDPGVVAGPHAAHHLVIRPRSRGPNTFAIGAIVRLEAGGRRQMRLITAGTSFMGQEPAEAFFGLGAATAAERVSVEWPDGKRSSIGPVAGDRQVEIHDSLLLADGFESGLAVWSSDLR